MNKFHRAFTLALLFLLLTGIPLSSCVLAQEEEFTEDTLWEVYESQPDLVLSNWILVEDKFRLKKPGNSDKYLFKPLQKLRNRWGHSGNPNFSAVLHRVGTADQNDEKLYCGRLIVSRPGHDTDGHSLALSYVSTDLVILEILHDECDKATYHKSHGGLAHAERN